MLVRPRLAFSALALLASGCAGLLGLDDFAEGESSASGGGGPGAGTTTGAGDPGVTDGAGNPTAGGADGGSGPGPGGAGQGGDEPTTVEVTPGDQAKVGILRSLAFTANVDVDWSVTEDDGGTIDENGFYLSPELPGTFHVVAISRDDASASAEVEVTVVPLGLEVVGGTPGGPGNIDGPPTRARFTSPGGVAVVDNGQKLVVADSGNHTIRLFDAQDNEVRTLAGTPGLQGSDDGIGPAARFSNPHDIIADEDEQLVYVLDGDGTYGPTCIRSIDVDTGEVRTLAGVCGTSGSVDAAQGSGARFDGIDDMTLAPDGSGIYLCQVTDVVDDARKIRHVAVGTGATTTLGVTGINNSCVITTDFYRNRIYFNSNTNDRQIKSIDMTRPNPTVTNLVTIGGADSSLGALAAITGFGSSDEVYTFDTEYDDVTGASLPSIGTYTIGGAPMAPLWAPPFGYVDGALDVAEMTRPAFPLGYGPYGNLYFVDSGAHAIRVVDIDALEVDTVVGVPGTVKAVDGPKNVARVHSPFGVALAEDASFVYFTSGAYRAPIRRVDVQSGAVEIFSGVPGDAPLDGPADQAVLLEAAGIVRVGDALYVADSGTTIRRILLSDGSVETITGTYGEPGNEDGFGTAAHFDFDPFISGGLATDGTDLYVADGNNHAIRKIDLVLGEVTTIAGGTEGSADGVGTDAQFRMPAGLAFDDGFLYVTDIEDQVLRRIDLASGEVTTLTGQSGIIGIDDGSPTTATFAYPQHVVADGIGNLFVTGLFFTSTIRRIDLDTVETSAFDGDRVLRGFSTGPLPNTLGCPAGMVVDPAGDLVFADTCDGVVGAIRPL